MNKRVNNKYESVILNESPCCFDKMETLSSGVSTFIKMTNTLFDQPQKFNLNFSFLTEKIDW
jgi:hypothetical protein